ncbi:MAG: orotidine-5'-phosphate decarboxylase [Deltaproteobacteria bacterium]|nr:orotidine-5'-phosphate decarboxylase [Deltaproteobacteria bacterium]
MEAISSERIIIALDVASFNEAEKFVKLLKHTIGIFKVGKQLFTHCGPKVVEMIQHHGGKVFLDLKFHDIPNTVARAVGEACKLGVFMLTLHAMGGKKMMQEAVHASIKQAQALSSPPPFLLAVTILTSLRQEDFEGIGIVSSMEEAVLRLAKLSKRAGVHGVIASAREASLIRANCGEDFIIVTPGIRPKGVALDDQKRAVTPGEAILAGSDYIVIGRPILEAKDPLKVANEIVEELRKVSV